MAANSPAHGALVRVRQAEDLIESGPLPVREILFLIIRAVIALAHAVIKLEDAAGKGERS